MCTAIGAKWSLNDVAVAVHAPALAHHGQSGRPFRDGMVIFAFHRRPARVDREHVQWRRAHVRTLTPGVAGCAGGDRPACRSPGRGARRRGRRPRSPCSSRGPTTPARSRGRARRRRSRARTRRGRSPGVTWFGAAGTSSRSPRSTGTSACSPRGLTSSRCA